MLGLQALRARIDKNGKVPLKVWGVVLLAGLGLTAVVLQSMSAPATTSGVDANLTGAMQDPVLFTPGMALDVLLKLGIVVTLIYAGVYLLKRFQPNQLAGETRKLAVIESMHLNQRQALHLVRVGEQVLLVGATDQGLNLLSEVDLQVEDPEASTPEAISTGKAMGMPLNTAFAGLLARTLNQSK